MDWVRRDDSYGMGREGSELWIGLGWMRAL